MKTPVSHKPDFSPLFICTLKALERWKRWMGGGDIEVAERIYIYIYIFSSQTNRQKNLYWKANFPNDLVIFSEWGNSLWFYKLIEYVYFVCTEIYILLSTIALLAACIAKHNGKPCRNDMNCWSWVAIVCRYLRYERGEKSNRVDIAPLPASKPAKVFYNQTAHTIMEIQNLKRLRATAEIFFIKNQACFCTVVGLNFVRQTWQRPTPAHFPWWNSGQDCRSLMHCLTWLFQESYHLSKMRIEASKK